MKGRWCPVSVRKALLSPWFSGISMSAGLWNKGVGGVYPWAIQKAIINIFLKSVGYAACITNCGKASKQHIFGNPGASNRHFIKSWLVAMIFFIVCQMHMCVRKPGYSGFSRSIDDLIKIFLSHRILSDLTYQISVDNYACMLQQLRILSVKYVCILYQNLSHFM